MKSGLPSREIWRNGPLLTLSPPPVVPQRDLLAARGRPHADHRGRVGLAVLARSQQLRGRDLHGDRVHVQLGGGVDPLGGLVEDVHPVLGVQFLERAQVGEVEDRAEVHVEALGPLAGEHLDAAGDRAHRLVGQVGVVRGRQRPDVARRAGQVLAQHLALAVLDAGHVVELAAVPVRAVERQDRAGVVEERVRVPQLGLEVERVGDVVLAVAAVVNVDLVQHVVAERVEVRPARRALQGDVVGDQRDRVGLVGADEGVHVGAVGNRVLRDLRCLAV